MNNIIEENLINKEKHSDDEDGKTKMVNISNSILGIKHLLNLNIMDNIFSGKKRNEIVLAQDNVDFYAIVSESCRELL